MNASSPPKQKTVRLQDIADELGISVVTVGKVLNNSGGKNTRVSEQTATRIRECAVKLGYRPNLLARSLKQGHSRNIGIICCALQNEIGAQEVIALTNELLKYNYTTQLFYDRGEQELLQRGCLHLAANGCDALIICQGLSRSEIANLPELPIPLFFKNCCIPSLVPHRTIFMDFAVGCQAALQRLTELNHRHFLLVSGSWDNLKNDSRYRTFAKFMSQRGENLEDHLLLNPQLADLTQPQLLTALQKVPETTAILCSNDLFALKTIQLLHKSGFAVPADFSVVGFDDIASGTCSIPALTTIHTPVFDSAVEMVKLIRNELEQLQLPVQTTLPCQLVERGSIAPARSRELNFSQLKNLEVADV